MKSSFISALLFGAAIAVPANLEKRSLVLVEEVVTQWTTVTVYAGHKPTDSASRKQAAFFEFPSSFTYSVPTASALPSLVASSSISAPPPPPPPVVTPPPAVAPPVLAVASVAAPIVASIAAVVPAPAAPASGSGPSGTGEITFYSLGTVSCGQKYSDSDAVVALSTNIMTQYQGANPNNNSLCGKTIHITLNGKTVTGTVVDTCMGCATGNVDLSPSLFSQLADFGAGRVAGATWYVE